MTVNEALLQVDGYLPNRVDEREKLVWLSRVEKRIIDEVHSRYPELARGGEFTGFTADNKETKLCVPMPYDELYVHFLAAEIQLKLHEQKEAPAPTLQRSEVFAQAHGNKALFKASFLSAISPHRKHQAVAGG